MNLHARISTAIAALLLVLSASSARAHCDGLDGPVVKTAQEALEKGNVDAVLPWVQPKDEAEIRTAFERTVAVRRQSADAKKLADQWFFETLVRVHRTGEGASFTGLKPAGRDLGPAIPAADKALETGDAAPLEKMLTDEAKSGLRDRFQKVIAAKAHRKESVDAGRKYVQAYVAWIHYAERLHEAAKQPSEEHYPEATPAAHDEL